MSDNIDPQVTSAAITAGGGILTGIFGAWWRWGRGRTMQDLRCERICNSMLGLGQTLIAVIKALGIDEPRVTPHIQALETQMSEARAMLNEPDAN